MYCELSKNTTMQLRIGHTHRMTLGAANTSNAYGIFCIYHKAKYTWLCPLQKIDAADAPAAAKSTRRTKKPQKEEISNSAD